jgi:hypothetical protein
MKLMPAMLHQKLITLPVLPQPTVGGNCLAGLTKG